jgi:hypothetical protein
MPTDNKKPKTANVEATNMIRAAHDLDEHIPLSIGDQDVIGMISQQISNKTARAAQNTADTMLLESEIEKRKTAKVLNDLERPSQQTSSQPGSVLPGVGGLGGRSAIVHTILNAIPPEKRAEFVQQNKDMLLSDSSPSGLFGLLGKPQTSQSGGGGFGPLEMAGLITALGEESRQNMLMAQRMQPQQSQQSQNTQPTGVVSQIEFVNLIRDMQSSNITMLQQVTKQFSDLVGSVTQQFRDIDDKHKQDTMDLRRQLLDSQKEGFEKDKEFLMRRIDELQQAPATPANVLTLNHIPLIREALGQAGMKLSTENAAQEGERRKWDLEDRKLDIAQAREEREAARLDRERENELEKTRLRNQALTGLAQIVGSAYQSKRVSTAIETGGSEAAKAISGGRINE